MEFCDFGEPAYAAFYCEENVWHLSQDARLGDRQRWVAFISNPSRSCALWSQRASASPELPVIWDYHVVLLAESSRGSGVEVWDLDSLAGMPLALDLYLKATFLIGHEIPESFRPWFRVVEAEDFARTFSSDRTHMQEGGRWIHPPPPWPLIQVPGTRMNLDLFVDMGAKLVGEVLTLAQLCRKFDCDFGPDSDFGPDCDLGSAS